MNFFECFIDGTNTSHQSEYTNIEKINANAIEAELGIFESQMSIDFDEKFQPIYEDREFFYESAYTDLINKVKKFINKTWMKITKVFSNMLKYMNGKVVVKHRKFAQKYKDEIKSKISGSLKGLEITTYSNLIKDDVLVNKKINTPLKIELNKIPHFYFSPKTYFEQYKSFNLSFNSDKLFSELAQNNLGKAYTRQDIREELLNDILGEEKSFTNENELKMLGEFALSYLLNKIDGSIKNVLDIKKDIDQLFQKILSEIDKIKVNTTKDTTQAQLDIYRVWLDLFVKEVNTIKDFIVFTTSTRAKIIQSICMACRIICIRIHLFNTKNEAAIDEDAFYSLFNYTNIINGFDPIIIL